MNSLARPKNGSWRIGVLRRAFNDGKTSLVRSVSLKVDGDYGATITGAGQHWRGILHILSGTRCGVQSALSCNLDRWPQWNRMNTLALKIGSAGNGLLGLPSGWPICGRRNHWKRSCGQDPNLKLG